VRALVKRSIGKKRSELSLSILLKILASFLGIKFLGLPKIENEREAQGVIERIALSSNGRNQIREVDIENIVSDT
jgi:hypothetical protein